MEFHGRKKRKNMSATMSTENVFMFFPENRGWSHQMTRLIGESQNGGGDFGEIFRATKGMKVGDQESWFSEWTKMANYVEELGNKASKDGKRATARECYFRASNYYRMADFYLGRNDPREHPAYQKHVGVFQKAAALSDNPKIEPVWVPYEGKKLHAYFVESSRVVQDERRPCVVIFGGADATCEETYFNSAVDAARRGLDALLLDGPGQGYTLRFEELYAIFDYERAVAAAIDYLESTKGHKIKPEKIGLVGRSMGGYYASRSAAMEKRIKAAVVFDAIFDIATDVYDFFTPTRKAVEWDIGANNEKEAREKLAKFNLNGIAEKISCPVLIIHGEDDYVSSPKAADRLYAVIPHSDKLLKWYKAGHGASAFRSEAMELVFDWLSEKLS